MTAQTVLKKEELNYLFNNLFLQQIVLTYLADKDFLNENGIDCDDPVCVSIPYLFKLMEVELTINIFPKSDGFVYYAMFEKESDASIYIESEERTFSSIEEIQYIFLFNQTVSRNLEEELKFFGIEEKKMNEFVGKF